MPFNLDGGETMEPEQPPPPPQQNQPLLFSRQRAADTETQAGQDTAAVTPDIGPEVKALFERLRCVIV